MNLIIKKTIGYQLGHPYNIENVNPETTTIGQIKQMIYSLIGIKVHFQILRSMGRVLEPDSELCSSLLKKRETHTIHLSPDGLEAIKAFHQKPYACHPPPETSAVSPPEMVVTISDLLGKRYQWEVSPLSTVREMKLRLQDTYGCHPEQVDFVCRGVCLKEDVFTLSDYNVGHDPRLHVVQRLHRSGVPWSVAHEQRVTRIVKPFTQGQAPASLYPHALEHLGTGTSAHNSTFAALRESLPAVLRGSVGIAVPSRNEPQQSDHGI